MPKHQRDGSMSATHSQTSKSVHPQVRGDDMTPTAAGSAPPKKRMTACAPCRKQKIKCEMPDSGPACIRCMQRGISCYLNKNLHAGLSDQQPNELLQQDLQNMHDVLQRLCQKTESEPPVPLLSAGSSQLRIQSSQALDSESEVDEDNTNESSPPITPSSVQAPIDTFMSIAKTTQSATGASSHRPRNNRTVPSQSTGDLISQGLISFRSAEILVQRYYAQLDQSLYGIASRYKSIQDVRQASSTLLAAICTVSALHGPTDQKLYEICNCEFRRLVSTALFERCGIEHIRALCIGSFWLSDASRILTSDAVRRAADVRLHGYFHEVIDAGGSKAGGAEATISREDARDRIRLWYVIFICDQHLSILHNYDGLLRHEKGILEMWDIYLNSEGGTETDTRLMSQVSILLISNAVRDAFGSEHPDQVHKSLLVQLNHFSRQLDEWFIKISALYNADHRIGDFPKAGIEMHLQFGKLYLGHHVFRGLKSDPIPLHFLPAAIMAYEAAIAIFKMILHNVHLYNSMLGRPHYVFIMISFAGHFLLEVCKKYSQQLTIDVESAFRLIDEVLTVLTRIRQIPLHPIARMTAGLRRKLLNCAMSLAADGGRNGAPSMNTAVGQSAIGIGTANSLVHPRANADGMLLFGTTTTMSSAENMLPGGNANAAFCCPAEAEGMDLSVGDEQFLFADYTEFDFPDMSMNFMP